MLFCLKHYTDKTQITVNVLINDHFPIFFFPYFGFIVKSNCHGCIYCLTILCIDEWFVSDLSVWVRVCRRTRNFVVCQAKHYDDEYNLSNKAKPLHTRHTKTNTKKNGGDKLIKSFQQQSQNWQTPIVETLNGKTGHIRLVVIYCWKTLW